MNIKAEANRYIDCNLQHYKERVEKYKPHRIEVISDYGNMIFYLEDCMIFDGRLTKATKAGDIVEYGKKTQSFLNYDYSAARKWDLVNAGIELSNSY